MPKVKLNLEPDEALTFKREIAIPTPDGKGLKIEFEFKHRTREDMASLMEGYVEKARAAKDEDAEPDDSPRFVEAVKEAIARDVETIMDMAVGWNVDGYPFTRDNLTKFVRLYPAAGLTIATEYRVAMIEGRLGN